MSKYGIYFKYILIIIKKFAQKNNNKNLDKIY